MADAKRTEAFALVRSVVARLLCLANGGIAVLGGLFFAIFTPGIAAGLLGVAAACLPARGQSLSTAIIVLSALAFLTQIVDAVWYYVSLNIPGNYYAWPGALFAGFAFALMAWTGWHGLRKA